MLPQQETVLLVDNFTCWYGARNVIRHPSAIDVQSLLVYQMLALIQLPQIQLFQIDHPYCSIILQHSTVCLVIDHIPHPRRRFTSPSHCFYPPKHPKTWQRTTILPASRSESAPLPHCNHPPPGTTMNKMRQPRTFFNSSPVQMSMCSPLRLKKTTKKSPTKTPLHRKSPNNPL